MTTTKLKPSYKTETVKKDDGTIIQIGRVALSDLDTLLEIQDWLVYKYIESDGAIGKFIADPELRSKLQTLCSLLPIIGSKNVEQEYLNFEDISENWEQLILLFFNGQINMENRQVNDISPSKVSQLHFLPYNEMMLKHLNQKRKELEKPEKD